MNQGVEILLARMDSNPDEFMEGRKWNWVVTDLQNRVHPTPEMKKEGYLPLRFLSDDEVRTLWEKLESLRADQFTKAVMQTLLDEEEGVDPFAEALRAGIKQFPHYQIKPNKIAIGRSQYEALKKEYADVFPDIGDAAYQQLADDLQALEASKKRRKK